VRSYPRHASFMHTDLRLCAFLASSGRFEISGGRSEAAACCGQHRRVPKTKAMARLSRLTVALDIYAWNATVKLWGTRWTGGCRVVGAGWLVWLVAVPGLPCRADCLPPTACRHLPTDSTGCARWLSGPVPGGCGDTVGVVCGGVLLSAPRGCWGVAVARWWPLPKLGRWPGGGALPMMGAGAAVPERWDLGCCPSLPTPVAMSQGRGDVDAHRRQPIRRTPAWSTRYQPPGRGWPDTCRG